MTPAHTCGGVTDTLLHNRSYQSTFIAYHYYKGREEGGKEREGERDEEDQGRKGKGWREREWREGGEEVREEGREGERDREGGRERGMEIEGTLNVTIECT